jgi:hypothetical protein
MCAFLISTMRATCHVHFIPLDLIAPIKIGEEYNCEAPDYRIYIFLHPPVTAYLRCQIFFSETSFQRPSVYAGPL